MFTVHTLCVSQVVISFDPQTHPSPCQEECLTNISIYRERSISLALPSPSLTVVS